MTKIGKRMKRLVTGLLSGALFLGGILTSTAAYAADEDTMRAQAEEALSYGYYYLANDFYPSLTEKMRAMTSANQPWYVQKYYQELKAQGLVGRYETALYADALRSCEKYEEALQMYDSAENDFTDNEQMLSYIMSGRARCLEALERYAQAEEAYRTAYEMSGNPEGYVNDVYKMYLGAEDADVERVVGQYLSGYSNEEIAGSLSGAGRYEEALAFYQKAEAEDGLDERLNIADVLCELDRNEEALAIYEELHEENPDDVSVLNRLGSIYCDAFGRYEDARAAFEKGIELNPEANVLMANLGIVSYKSGDYEGSAEQYRKIAEAYPSYTSVFFNYLSGKKDLSVQECMDFMSGFEGWPQSDEMQALLLLTKVSAGSLSKASLESWLTYFDGIVQSYPDNYYFLREKALLLKGLERYEEAEAVMQDAIAVAGMMEKYALNTLAGIYSQAGDYGKAAETKELVYEKFGEAGCYSSLTSYKLYDGDYEVAEQMLAAYDSLDGEYRNFFHMVLGYLTNDYETVLKYADLCLADDASDIKAKAYKAAALQELGMDGAKELIAEIDSRVYPGTDVDKMIADCILGRLDSAKAIYRNLLAADPGTAAEEKNDYELRNLFYDAEFCEMAGRELLVKESEEATEETGTLVESEGTAGESGTEVVVMETKAASPILPIAAGAASVLALAGVAVTLVRKRSAK